MRARALLFALFALASACGNGSGSSDVPPIPTTHDPKGEDLVQGAVIAAVESNGGVRINKIVHVDDLPPPLDYELHMIAYDPKAPSFEDAARQWKNKDAELKVIVPHFLVRRVDYLTRDYRVIAKEKVTPEERAPYEASIKSRSR